MLIVMKRNFLTEVFAISANETDDLFLAKGIKIWSKSFKNALYFVIAVVKYNRKLLKGDQSQEKQIP